MKEQFENIDQIFRDKLSNMSPTPPDGSWDVINAAMNKNSKAIATKWFYAAASFIALAIAGVVLWNTSNRMASSENESVAIVENNEITKPTKQQNQVIVSSKAEKNITIASKELKKESSNDALNSEKSISINKSNQLVDIKKESKVNNIAPFETKENIEQQQLMADLSGVSPERLFSSTNFNLKKGNTTPSIVSEDNIEEKKFVTNFSIGGHITPTLSYRNNGGTNSGLSESPAMFSSGGMYIEGQVGKKLRLKTGFYFLQLGSYQDFYYVRKAFEQVYTPSSSWEIPAVAEPIYYVSFDNAIGSVELEEGVAVSSEEQVENYELTIAENTNISENNELISSATRANSFMQMDKANAYTKVEDQTAQRIKNIEIPIIFSYNFLNNNRLSLNLISGVSANFVTESSFYRVKDNLQLGSYANIKTVNYSTTIGIGIEYPIIRNINLTFEPTFKYFVNSINNIGTDKVHPYTFGVYTGLKYTL